MLLCWWLLHQQENSKLVFPRKDKPENTFFWPTLWESSKWSVPPTRWMRRQSAMLKPDMKKLLRKWEITWRRLDTTQTTFPSSQFQDGLEITCWKNHQTCHGTRVQHSLKHWMQYNHQRDQLKNHSDYHYKTYTRLEVLVQCQSEELKPVSWNQVWSSNLLHQASQLKLSQLKCIMKPFQRLSQETMSDSMLRTLPSRTWREDMFAQIQRMMLPENATHSMLKSLSSTIQDKFKTDIPQFWIATQPILLANSKKFFQRMTEEQVESLKRNQSSLNQEMLPWLS